jgi:glutamate dehydrogenase (NAD(P)+)
MELYQFMGGKIISVASWNNAQKKAFTFKKEDGIDIHEIRKIANKFGEINIEKAEEQGYEILDGDDWLAQDVDILFPAALENQINEANVNTISENVKVIVEGANGPTTIEADKVIQERNIWMIPDFLANAGGVTCSYFEQVQNNMNYYWEREEVFEKLDQAMTKAYHAVSELAKSRKIYMRDAAYMIAVQRVAESCKMRGWV